jgi:ribonuclease BN (tRNA processing enzyme)
MIESGGSFYFIDAGAPVIDATLRHGLDMHNFRAIFTTHAHGDHTSGIFQIADLINWYYRDCSADFYLTDPRLRDIFEQQITVSNNDNGVDRDRVRFKIADVGAMYEDENIKVEYIRNAHMTTSPSYSILVSEGDKKVLFSGDFSGHLRANDVPTVLLEEDIDAFICELAHFEVSEIKPYLDRSHCKRVFFTHVYPDSKYDDVKVEISHPSFELFTPCDNDSYEI